MSTRQKILRNHKCIIFELESFGSVRNVHRSQFIMQKLINFFFTFNSTLQEVTGDDDSDLYLLEREIELKSAQDAKRRFQMTVPGILGPHELPEEMQDE